MVRKTVGLRTCLVVIDVRKTGIDEVVRVSKVLRRRGVNLRMDARFVIVMCC